VAGERARDGDGAEPVDDEVVVGRHRVEARLHLGVVGVDAGLHAVAVPMTPLPPTTTTRASLRTAVLRPVRCMAAF
jgi:hypothetical protein